MNINNFKFNKRDEYDTPEEPITAIIPILKRYKWIKTIWLCADQKHSNFVKVLEKHGFNVIYSHIFDGQDFLKYEPQEKYDLILTNPPFSLKKEFVERSIQLKKPFMFLLGMPILNYKDWNSLQRKYQLSEIRFDGSKLSYDGKQPSFQSGYFHNLEKFKIEYVNLPKTTVSV